MFGEVMKSLVKRIQTFNKNRDPELVQRKYKLMRADVFSFYRGTCHLFYQDWPAKSELNETPLAWLSGDLHLENFGSYKGDNRLVYFDINDFDESALAPCTWDLARMLTSILVGKDALGVDDEQAELLCQLFVDKYAQAIATGHARMVERATANGLIGDLLNSLKARSRKAFLDQHTEKHGRQRRLCIDGVHTLAVSRDDRDMVMALIETWRKTQSDPDFLSVIDVAHHVAGTGSLGLQNFLLLVQGDGSPNTNFLVTLKEEPPSSLSPYLTIKQPKWENDAARVVASQQRLQGTSPALLSAVPDAQRAYILREYQPIEDRVALDQWNGKFGRIEKLIGTLGEIVAWDQLRSSGRQGSAIADELIAFGSDTTWQQPLLDYAHRYSEQVKADYATFCTTYDKAEFAPAS